MSLLEVIPGALVRHTALPIWLRSSNPSTSAFLHEIERTQFSSPDAIEALQMERLRKLLNYAKVHCPFYSQRIESAGLDVNGIQSLEELRRIPVLTKKDIQDHGHAMVSTEFPAEDRIRNQTGGSTGSPLQFFVDKNRIDTRLAATIRHNAWADYRPADWCALLWGARVDLPAQSSSSWKGKVRQQLLDRQIPLNTSSVSSADFLGFYERLLRLKPRILLAYAQSAAAFARFLTDRGLEYRFESIIITAEMLPASTRAFVEQTIGGKVFDRYGCREVSVIASECELHTGLHINAESLVVEVLHDPSLPARAGRVLVTDLLNFSQPLIRYEIGDIAELAEEPCSCGRGLPMLKNIHGRATDFLHLRNGRVVSGPALTLVVADMSNVAQVQFVQRAPEQIILRVVPRGDYGPPTREELKQRLSMYLKGDASLEIEEVSELKSEASGKYRFVINEMQTGERAER